VSYIIALYFGRNLREMIQVWYHTSSGNSNRSNGSGSGSGSSSGSVLREYRNSLFRSIPPMNGTLFFDELKKCPTIAVARFPLYDSTGDTIGDLLYYQWQ